MLLRAFAEALCLFDTEAVELDRLLVLREVKIMWGGANQLLALDNIGVRLGGSVRNNLLVDLGQIGVAKLNVRVIFGTRKGCKR